MKHKILSSDFYTRHQADDITEIQINSIPTLYKYQQVSDYSLTHLDNGELWGTLPSAFNDPYDCICCYTKSKIMKAINEQLSDERFNSYKALFHTNSRSQIIEKLTLSLLSKLNENFRSQLCVACFSIYNDSEIMWGHYADCAKGFVVAYDGDDLKNCALASNASTIEIIKSMNLFGSDFSKLQEDIHTTIMPIIYSDGKVNITENLIRNLPLFLEYYDDLYNGLTFGNVLNKYINKTQETFYANLKSSNDMLYSILCNKNKCWSYEQEWRVWAYNSNIFTGNLASPYVRIGNVPAKAIYLGEHITSYNKLILIQIARTQNIPIYQMKTKMYKNYCKLQPTLLDYYNPASMPRDKNKKV